MQLDNHSLALWKLYVSITIESLLSFYLATFSIVVFFFRGGVEWLPLAILMGVLYAFVIAVCVKRLIAKLPLATLMLLVPLVPLVALIIFVSLIPVLQLLK